MWTPNFDITFTNGVPSLLQVTNHNIASISYEDSTPIWVTQPTNSSVSQTFAATFYATATSGGEALPLYQWYRGSTPVAGATSTSIYLPLTWRRRIMARPSSSVSTSPVSGLTSTSQVATLTVIPPVFEKGVAKVEYLALG